MAIQDLGLTAGSTYEIYEQNRQALIDLGYPYNRAVDLALEFGQGSTTKKLKGRRKSRETQKK